MCPYYSQNTIGLLLYNRTDVTVVKVNSNGHFLLDMIGHDKKGQVPLKTNWVEVNSLVASVLLFSHYRTLVHFRKKFSVLPSN